MPFSHSNSMLGTPCEYKDDEDESKDDWKSERPNSNSVGSSRVQLFLEGLRALKPKELEEFCLKLKEGKVEIVLEDETFHPNLAKRVQTEESKEKRSEVSVEQFCDEGKFDGFDENFNPAISNSTNIVTPLLANRPLLQKLSEMGTGFLDYILNLDLNQFTETLILNCTRRFTVVQLEPISDPQHGNEISTSLEPASSSDTKGNFHTKTETKTTNPIVNVNVNLKLDYNCTQIPDEQFRNKSLTTSTSDCSHSLVSKSTTKASTSFDMPKSIPAERKTVIAAMSDSASPSMSVPSSESGNIVKSSSSCTSLNFGDDTESDVKPVKEYSEVAINQTSCSSSAAFKSSSITTRDNCGLLELYNCYLELIHLQMERLEHEKKLAMGVSYLAPNIPDTISENTLQDFLQFSYFQNHALTSLMVRFEQLCAAFSIRINYQLDYFVKAHLFSWRKNHLDLHQGVKDHMDKLGTENIILLQEIHKSVAAIRPVVMDIFTPRSLSLSLSLASSSSDKDKK